MLLGQRSNSQYLHWQLLCLWVAHDFRMFWKQKGFLTSSGKSIKDRKQVTKFLDTIQQLRQLAIFKISGLCQENQLADAAVKAALSNQIIQTWECSLFLIKSIKDFLLQFQKNYKRKHENMAMKREKLWPRQTDMTWAQWKTNLTYRVSITYTSTCTWTNTWGSWKDDFII